VFTFGHGNMLGCAALIIDMSSKYRVSNSCTPSTTYFGNSYNNRNSEHNTSTSQVFVDHITVEDNIAPILVRILVVDDEPDINLVIKIMLERQKGFRVISFVDPDLALQSFTPGLYDLLLLDIKSPNMNGIDLYNKIRKIDENIKVCFMSANKYYYEEFRNQLTSSAETNPSFLQKPFRYEELLRSVNKMMA
jgi:CheY-like chemotaxis protein